MNKEQKNLPITISAHRHISISFHHQITKSSYQQISNYVFLTCKVFSVQDKVRPHMSCGNLTPDVAHQTIASLKKLWKNKIYRKAKSVSL